MAAGPVLVFSPTDMYFGERTACVTDVAGNDWWIAAPLENLSLGEIQKRAVAFVKARIVEAT